jgi:outer membrane lipopolysaccharide assembly protein LptE/RlpB
MFATSSFSSFSSAKLLITTLCLTLLVGCGFALRGNIEIPLEAQAIWIDIKGENDRSLRDSFNSLAKSNGLHIDESADNKIFVTNYNFRRITTTLDSNAKVDEYTLRGELRFDIVGLDEQVIASQLDAFAERTFQYDANDASASNSREAFLKDEVFRSLSEQILRQYAAHFRLK